LTGYMTAAIFLIFCIVYLGAPDAPTM